MKACCRKDALGKRCGRKHNNSHPWCTPCRTEAKRPHAKLLRELAICEVEAKYWTDRMAKVKAELARKDGL